MDSAIVLQGLADFSVAVFGGAWHFWRSRSVVLLLILLFIYFFIAYSLLLLCLLYFIFGCGYR